MQSATSPPGGNPTRKRRSVSLRRSRVTTVTGFAPGDTVRTVWSDVLHEWQVIVESANGLQIEHRRLTLPPAA
jgi:hypothetical protein